MRKILKKIIVFGLYYSGLNFLYSLFLSKKIFCVGYHSVHSDTDAEKLETSLYWNITVSESDFEKQLVYLKNNDHTFVRFSDLPVLDMGKIKKPTVVFFDDGFKDVLRSALPILKKHNIPATVFITTGLINHTHFLWTLALRKCLEKQGFKSGDIENKIKLFKKMKMFDREVGLEKMFKQYNFEIKDSDYDIFLSWDDVLTLTSEGIEIGSHTVTHPKLIEVNSDELLFELANSKQELEQKIAKKINTISYPYGRHNDQVIKVAHEVGYALGMTTRVGYNSIEDITQHPFEIKRINPEEDKSLLEFKVRLYTGI